MLIRTCPTWPTSSERLFHISSKMRLRVATFSVLLQALSVLCEESSIFPNIPLTVQKEANKEEPSSRFPNIPEDCGNVRPTWRVDLSARKTELYEFPFYVELIYENAPSHNDSLPTINCGGTLISDRFAVTAASCVQSKPKIISVRLGEHDLDTNPDCYKQARRKICAPPHLQLNVTSDDIIVHSLYDKNGTEKGEYDIALIKLPERVTLTDAIEPVCLPIKPTYQKQGNLTLIGFPKLEASSARSNTLLSIPLPHVTNAECEILLNKPIESRYLCAGGRNRKKYCGGYGGSPVLYVVVEEYRLRWVLGGILPYGRSICDDNNLPKVLTRMQAHNEWILENIKV